MLSTPLRMSGLPPGWEARKPTHHWQTSGLEESGRQCGACLSSSAPDPYQSSPREPSLPHAFGRTAGYLTSAYRTRDERGITGRLTLYYKNTTTSPPWYVGGPATFYGTLESRNTKRVGGKNTICEVGSEYCKSGSEYCESAVVRRRTSYFLWNVRKQAHKMSRRKKINLQSLVRGLLPTATN